MFSDMAFYYLTSLVAFFDALELLFLELRALIMGFLLPHTISIGCSILVLVWGKFNPFQS